MAFDSVLATAIEVSIAIGGFAGIVIVLGPSRGHEWSASSRLMLSALLLMSIAIVAFGFLPQILVVAGVSDNVLWPVSSMLHCVYLGGLTAHRVILSKRMPGTQDAAGFVAMRAAMVIVVLGVLVLQLANAIWLREAWPYLTAIVVMVIGTFAVFLELLREVWDST